MELVGEGSGEPRSGRSAIEATGSGSLVIEVEVGSASVVSRWVSSSSEETAMMTPVAVIMATAMPTRTRGRGAVVARRGRRRGVPTAVSACTVVDGAAVRSVLVSAVAGAGARCVGVSDLVASVARVLALRGLAP
jgi:hypothetical protein